MTRAPAEAEALGRLRFIEGHLAAVRRMVEEGRTCLDVLEQSYAVRRALQKFEATLLSGHLHGYVVTGIHDGREEKMVTELLRLYELTNR